MKKLIFIAMVVIGVRNSYGMNADAGDSKVAGKDDSRTRLLETEMGDLQLTDQKSGDEKTWTQQLLKKKDADDTNEYLVFRDFNIAIIEADAKTVETMLAQISSRNEYFKYNAYFKRMIKEHPYGLVRDFNEKLGAMLKQQWPYPKEWPWPFNPLWLALEMVIYGERHDEPKQQSEKYKSRLNILKQLREVCGYGKYDYEPLVIRKPSPPSSCACWWSCLCMPCICYVCDDIKSIPQHRAAQANSLKAFKILASATEKYYADSEGIWGPLEYAIRFGAADIVAELGGKNGFHYVCCGCCRFMESSPCLACFSGNKEVRKMVYSEGYCCWECLNRKTKA